ncbi:MAG TPA: hypothetical protein VGF63_06670 [Solirubrobacteraceae bacterium]
MQPRQIYASTLTRRERRARRRARGHTAAISFVLVTAATLAAALWLLTFVVPGVT